MGGDVPAMRRRRFLTVTAAASALPALAGCTQSGDRSNDDPNDDATESDSPGTQSTDSPTDTTDTDDERTDSGDHPTTVVEDVLVNKSFTVTESGSGTERNEATIDFDAEATEVVVTGTIPGANGCKTAELGAVQYDEQADQLSVTVQTIDIPDSGDACTQAIVEIDYEARFTFAESLPSEVSVTHDGSSGRREVASAAHDSTSAGTPADQ